MLQDTFQGDERGCHSQDLVVRECDKWKLQCATQSTAVTVYGWVQNDDNSFDKNFYLM